MPSVVLTTPQITAIANHFCQVWFPSDPTKNTTGNTAICATDQIQSGISSLAMSVSIGGGSVSYSPAFSPPLSSLSASQQSALICYIIQTAMGVPLIG